MSARVIPDFGQIVGRDPDEHERALWERSTHRIGEAPGSWRIDLATCGACSRVWNNAAGSDITPAPSARCPFEYQHEPETPQGTTDHDYAEAVRLVLDAAVTAYDSDDQDALAGVETALAALLPMDGPPACDVLADAYAYPRGERTAALREYVITTANGRRTWHAEDEQHAREQHADAFTGEPGEDVLAVELEA